MAAADTPSARSVGSPGLDLKWSLTLRVVAVALVCFLVAAAYVLLGTCRDIRRNNEQVADIVVRQLQMQLFRIQSDIDLAARFPDWDPVVERVQSAGQCVRYLDVEGSVGRSSCVGPNGADGMPPAWLAVLGTWLLAGHGDVALPVSYRGKPYGSVVVTTDRAAILGTIWRDVARLLGLTALLVGAICILQYVAIGRALRPAQSILAGLDRLARGDLSCRLPGFRLIELQRISEVFNTLAAGLDRTTRERTALAARLVDGQEQQRRHLARELHDELAQNLSAMNALAASIRTSAEAGHPALARQAARLSQASQAMMRSLRATLHDLRPPEIDDFGLKASLTALARDQERRSDGALEVALEIEDDIDELPPTAASHIYRIVQEGLTNIAKHAHARNARITLGFRSEPGHSADGAPRWLALIIEDDGSGAAEVEASGVGAQLGLIGMRERAMALGGQLEIGPRPERGFRLEALIPFEPRTARLP